MPYASAFCAASCSFRSSVSRSAWPGFEITVCCSWLRGRPSESTFIFAAPATPRRYESYEDSTPAWPITSPGLYPFFDSVFSCSDETSPT